jgi:hypothetical protein
MVELVLLIENLSKQALLSVFVPEISLGILGDAPSLGITSSKSLLDLLTDAIFCQNNILTV